MVKRSPFLRSILVPLDGSELAEQALPIASSLAQRGGGKLRLALVHQLAAMPVDLPGRKTFVAADLATRKAERAYLRRVQARLRQSGIRLSSAVTLTGPVAPALVTYVRELGIDLVIMATHGRGGVRRAWLGSVADHLIRHLEVPVLLVRAQDARAARERPPEGARILVPLDGSPLAEEALTPAATLARVDDAELSLLQVVYPVLLGSDPALPVPSAYDAELTTAMRTQAQDYLDSLAERLRSDGLRVSTAAVVGWSAADTILEAARPDRVTMVALATHGRGGLRRFALGSVADKLVRAGDVPTLVYRPPSRSLKRKGSSSLAPWSGRPRAAKGRA
jgi:nucleotide-binding universal stress UspA family protein